MDRSFITLSFVAFLAIAFTPAISVAQDISGPDGSDKLYVRVTNNRVLAGTPLSLVELKVTTSFGEVAIPVAKIDGIKLHADANDAAVVAFKNGDLVTGKLSLDKIDIKTEWGVAHVNTSQVEQITASKNAAFYPDNSGSTKGWKFSNNASAVNDQNEN